MLHSPLTEAEMTLIILRVDTATSVINANNAAIFPRQSTQFNSSRLTGLTFPPSTNKAAFSYSPSLQLNSEKQPLLGPFPNPAD